MIAKIFVALCVVLLLIADNAAVGFAALTDQPPQPIYDTYPQPLMYEKHVVVSCDDQPNEVDLRIRNLMEEDIFVTGEIHAMTADGAHQLLGKVERDRVTKDNYGGPMGRIAEKFPNGFTGTVFGSVTIYDLMGNPIAVEMLTETDVSCGSGSGKKYVDYTKHVVVACDQEPNQVDLRFRNEMFPETVLYVQGELWVQPKGGQSQLLSSVPETDEDIPYWQWGGPEGRIENLYPQGFEGMVWGWANLYDADWNVVAEESLGTYYLKCGADTNLTYSHYFPFVQTPPLAESCDDYAIEVTPPGGKTSIKPFGETPGPIYVFGDVFHAGQELVIRTHDNQPVERSYLGWYRLYTHETGLGPEWRLRATSIGGDPPNLGILYTWQAMRSLPDGTHCSVGLLIQWDP